MTFKRCRTCAILTLLVLVLCIANLFLYFQCVDKAFIRWVDAIGSLYKDSSSQFVDEVVLAFAFPEHLGGFQKDDDSLFFPKSNLPSTWLPFVEKGLIRLQLAGLEVRLWKPYPFLLDWMRHQCTFIEFTDVDELRSE